MRQIIIATLALSALAPISAHAQARMSDARYIAARECLAYADLNQLRGDPLDFRALREAVAAGYRSSAVSSEAREHARRLRAHAENLEGSEGGLEELREERDDACARFVERGLVQAMLPSTGPS